jgi:hypothetical protein
VFSTDTTAPQQGFQPNTPATPAPGSGDAQTAAQAPVAAGSPSYPFRLLRDETVLGTYPIASKIRPLGKLVSYLFVTDSRVIYSAEAKSIVASSFHTKEYLIPTITGVEVGRHRGLDALGITAAAGVLLNFIGLLIIAGLVGAAGANSYQGDQGYGWGVVLFAVLSLVVGGVAVAILRRPTAQLNVVGPTEPRSLANTFDLVKMLLIIVMAFIFGLLLGLIVIIWAIVRELGAFKADDAQLYATPENIDRIAYEVGALIIDVQARGTLAGK